MPPSAVHTSSDRTDRRFALAALLALATLTLPHAGCVNTIVMASKLLKGDPTVKSPFEQITGVSLAGGKQQVVFVCTAPAALADEYDTLQDDVQEEVARRMRLRDIRVAEPDRVNTALQKTGGRFDGGALARALPDATYLLHVDIEHFSHREDSSPNLYRGRAHGSVFAYEVRRTQGSASPPVVAQVFLKGFKTEFPTSHPISRDEMPETVFRRRFLDGLSDVIGRTFYDVHTSDLVAQD